ncbi:MAG: IclR family transcriptional regulator [Janthinobacterium lividum]
MKRPTLSEAPEHDDDAPDSSDRYQVPGLERGLRLLAEFDRKDRCLSAPELARRLKIPRSTVFRLLSTLERLGFVVRSESGRDYRLGMAVLRLGFEYLSSIELPDLGRPLLERLRDEINYPCNLVVRDQREVVYVAKAGGRGGFISSVNVGMRLPAHATVLGRVLLQDLSLQKIRDLYPEEHLEIFSSHTPKTALELFNLVQDDRRRGYVQHEGFFEASISSVGAPVRDQSGTLVAALGANIPTPHIDPSELHAIIRRVRETAEELSRLLGNAPERNERNVVNLWQR